jgi:H2-forming N5,N10-methylenetetrahydromethanopterin dehydrogenase-like enzyme
MKNNTTSIEINNDIIEAIKEFAADIGYDDNVLKSEMISIVTDMINEMLEESLEENFWA